MHHTSLRMVLTLTALAAAAVPGSAGAQLLATDSFGNVAAPADYDFVPLDGSGGPLGSALNLTLNGQADVDLPWAFPFYGAGYSRVSVSPNGALRFTPGAVTSGANTALPTAPGAVPDVAVYWDFLDPGYGAVRWRHDVAGDRFIVSWEGLRPYGRSGGVSFQVHLHPDGGLRVHWADLDAGDSAVDGGASATVGIQNAAGGGLSAGQALLIGANPAGISAGTGLYMGACAGDADGDGFISWDCGGDDCDDGDPTLSPLALEICDDAIDQDCDLSDLGSDVDADGSVSIWCGGDDCDDGDAAVSPSAVEVCADGVDNDCQGGTPDLFDGEGDGDLCDVDCDDADPAVGPSAVEICGDTIDQDCSGADQPADGDGDGADAVACGGLDCDDADAAVHPGIDGDGDGYHACVDCDDAVATTFPGAAEACDGIDTDCDGRADANDLDINSSAQQTNSFTDMPSNFMLDGTMSGNTTFSTTMTVAGSVGSLTDVDLNLSLIHSGAAELTFTVTSPTGTSVLLSQENGGLGAGFGSPTFDDEAANPIVNANAPFNGAYIPQSPLGALDGESADGVWTLTIVDSVPATNDGSLMSWRLDLTTQTGDDVDNDGFVDSCGDCDSASPSVHPGAPEICDDAIDQDCDGVDVVGDGDSDGFASAACAGSDCDDASSAVFPGAVEACNDGVDNDCDAGTLDLFDGDGDGSDCATDCDDGNGTVAPGAPELCGTTIDEDCDPGTVDLFDGDGDGSDCATDCDDGNPWLAPGAIEVLCSGLDEDCDPATPDIDDADADGAACDVDCDDSDPTAWPGAPEFVCDGIDQACNGLGNEVDGDLDGVPICAGDCDDDDPTRAPNAPEICVDGIDQDCDSQIDELTDGAYELDDDGALTFELCTFSFPFCGDSFTRLTLQSNGRLTFGDSGGQGLDDGSGADVSSAGSVSDLLGEAPQIAFLWSDLDPSFGGTVEVVEDDALSTFTVTLTGVSQSLDWGSSSLGPNDVTVTLDADGIAEISYGWVSADVALVGWACGGSGDVVVADLSDPDQPAAALLLGSGTESALYEQFRGVAAGGFDVDLASSTLELCLTAGQDADSDGWTDLCGDCDDSDGTVYPGAPELCDGDDHDCNGTIDDADADHDLYIAQACGGADCDDDDPETNPAQPELCDGLDNDCDGQAETGSEDDDGDGWLVCGGDCDDSEPAINPDGVEICNEHDDDCDDSVDEGFNRDQDADGSLNPVCGGDDCDDLDSDVAPLAEEQCDGKDNDCNGVVNDVDLDGDGYVAVACGGDDCVDFRAEINPGAVEVCDGNDTDCNGVENDVDVDGDGYLDADCGGDDCDDADPAISLDGVEVCDDGVDNDCDGGTDKGVEGALADPECSGCQCALTSGPSGAPWLAAWLLSVLWIGRRRR